MTKGRRAAQAIRALNLALVMGVLAVFYRTTVAAETVSWSGNPPAPPQTVEVSADSEGVFRDTKLYAAPEPPPRMEGRPRLSFDARLGRRVSLSRNGESLEPVTVGDWLPFRIDGRPVRLERIERDHVVLVLDGVVDEEIRVPRYADSTE